MDIGPLVPAQAISHQVMQKEDRNSTLVGMKDARRAVVVFLGVVVSAAVAFIIWIAADRGTSRWHDGWFVFWVVLLIVALALAVAGVWPDLAEWLGGTARARRRRRHTRPRPHEAGTAGEWVGRAELAQVVQALTGAGTGPVAVTTGLTGAGGFGKTTLARMACQHPAVIRQFGDRIGWVTVGRDTDGAGLAGLIGGVVSRFGGDGGPFGGVEEAGRALAEVLAGRGGRRLLVVDDVWTAGQLEPFAETAAGTGCRLLVTTRRPAVLDGTAAHQVKVDAMSEDVSGRLLTRGLPPLEAALRAELLEVTGGWPLLLGLVNRRLAQDVERGAQVHAAAAAVAGRLRAGGPAALDPLLLDIADEQQRDSAVAVTVGYSLDALPAGARERFFELGIFAEDAEVPLTTVALLWQQAAGIDPVAAGSLADALDGLSLLTLRWAGPEQVLVVHDVIREFALRCLGPAGQAAAHAALLAAVRPAPVPGPGSDSDAGAGSGTWWRMPQDAAYSPYLWQYLTYHLQAAGLQAELDEACTDLRFVAIRLGRSGPLAVEADLARSGSPVAARLRRAVAQNAHLLGPIEPASALATVLTSRLGGVPEVADQLPALRSGLRAWTAWPAWPLPDEPAGALRRVLAGHTSAVTAVAIAPDGTWLATASQDGTVRIWTPDRVGWSCTTALRIDDQASGCAWFPQATDLCIAGGKGLYKFALRPPRHKAVTAKGDHQR